MLPYFTRTTANALPIIPLTSTAFTTWYNHQTAFIKKWVTTNNFTANSGSTCLIPNDQGQLASVLLGVEDAADFWAIATLPSILKSGLFYIQANPIWNDTELQRYVVAWGLANYRFNQYKKSPKEITTAKLVLPHNCDYAYIENVINAVFLVRDLVNRPAEDLGPQELANVAITIAKKHKAQIKQIVGDDLLKQKYPLIHAVGRASHRAPRFIEFTCGNKNHPKLALVGKGICFDSGGLDLKPFKAMQRMKTDMTGAAHALALAQMIMTAKLPVHLHVALPIAENLLTSGSYRPDDIVIARNGKSIEIISTDAEGRLLLADALTRAAENHPHLILDFASLTGAAYAALGPDFMAAFTPNDYLANTVIQSLTEEKQLAWRLPLHKPYRSTLDSSIADINNCSTSGYGGAITAALFLQEFIPTNQNWMHFDFSGFNNKSLPGRPEGAEAMGLQGLFNYVKNHFIKSQITPPISKRKQLQNQVNATKSSSKMKRHK